MGAMDILLDGSGRRQEVFEKFQVCISISLPYAVCVKLILTQFCGLLPALLWVTAMRALQVAKEWERESRPEKLTYTYTQSLKHSNSFFWGL